MRGVRQDHQLFVAMRELLVEVEQIFHRRNAVVLAPHQQHGRPHFFRVDDRKIGCHVEISACWYLIAELQFDIGQDFADSGIRCAGFISRKNALDHGTVALARVVRAEIFHLLRPFLEGRRVGAFKGERCQHQTVDAFRFDRCIKSRPQRAGGLSHEMRFLLPGFAHDDLHRSLQVLRAAGNVGIAVCAARLAVIFVVHCPDIETPAREYVHD